jgi:hypothetical protein
VPVSINDTEHNNVRYYPERRILFTIMMNVIMLKVVMLSVVMLSVVSPSYHHSVNYFCCNRKKGRFNKTVTVQHFISKTFFNSLTVSETKANIFRTNLIKLFRVALPFWLMTIDFPYLDFACLSRHYCRFVQLSSCLAGALSATKPITIFSIHSLTLCCAA